MPGETSIICGKNPNKILWDSKDGTGCAMEIRKCSWHQHLTAIYIGDAGNDNLKL
jgi:hypothetical protein